MRTIAIKMKDYAEDIIGDGMQGTILNTLVFTLGVLSVAYIFLLGNMVFNIIERKALEAEAHTLSNQVADLEQSYMSQSNKVDLAFSAAAGFKEIKPTFVTRKSLSFITPVNNIKVARNEI